MKVSSQVALLQAPLRRVQSQPELPIPSPLASGQVTDCMEAVHEAKKQVIAWRDSVHQGLRGPAPKNAHLAVRVGSSEFGGDGAYSASARSRLYQTRDLWTLLTLNDPAQDLVIVHETLDPDILYYYLRLGVTRERPSFSSRLGRLRTVLLPSGSSSPHSLTARRSWSQQANHNLATRLLGHVSCQNAVTSHVKKHRRSTSSPPILSLYQNSPRMEAIAKVLELDALTTPVPKLAELGSKHGSRQIFKEAGVPLPFGINDPAMSPEALAEALCGLTRRAPFVDKWVCKITDGTASGYGNGTLDVSAVQRPIATQEAALALLMSQLNTPMGTRRFMTEVSERGAIIEAFIKAPAGARTTSPSVQGVIEANGTVHVLSSHEQILDSATGQSYEGCRYPADAAYRADIIRHAHNVGAALFERGGVGNFAVDFLAVENKAQATGWRLDAIEINLRETGTTPPYMMMTLLCGGERGADNVWRDASGQAKYYVACDSIQRESLKGVHPQTVIDAVAGAGLEFTATATSKRAAMTGVVLTLLPGVRVEGKIGSICIANSEAEARAMQQAFEACLAEVREAKDVLWEVAFSDASTPRGHELPSPRFAPDLQRRSRDLQRVSPEATCARAGN